MHKHLICVLLVILILAGGCTSSEQQPNRTTVTTTSTAHTDNTILTTATSNDRFFTHTDTDTPIPSAFPDAGTTTTTNTAAVTTTSSEMSFTNRLTGNSTTTISTATTNIGTASNTITFKATVRENIHKQPVKGITVTIYTDENPIPAGSGATDRNGVVYVNIPKGSSYKVVLSGLPAGYEAKNYYLFSTATVNITINKAAVQNESDHSNAQYDEGKMMTDFSMTDTDGNGYRLSDLLKEKQLVILDFWYASCEPCKSEFPFFEAAINKYGDKVTLLAINPFDSHSTIINLRQQWNANPQTSINFPMLQDTCKLSAGFGVLAYPTTVFIHSNGVILDIHEGAYSSEAAFLSDIERYLQ